MTSKQLFEIKNFCKPFYKKTGSYHAWDHIERVRKNMIKLAHDYKNINLNLLEASCFIHDIGRSQIDEGHSKLSFEIAEDFLKKIKITDKEIQLVKDIVVSHDIALILKSKTKEARIFFDADKLEILSVYGFVRVIFFLVEERNMDIDSAINFLWRYTREVEKKYLFTRQAKRIVKQDSKIIRLLVDRYRKGY